MEGAIQKTPTATETWFHDCESKRRMELSTERISHLVNFTKNWIRQTGDDIPRRIYDWISYPNSKFWGFTGFREDTKLVAYCVSDVGEGESSSKMDPVRRRVMLVILYDIIQKEKQRLQAEAEKCKAKKRKACNNTLKKPVPNNGSFLTQAIKNIINQTYCS